MTFGGNSQKLSIDFLDSNCKQIIELNFTEIVGKVNFIKTNQFSIINVVTNNY